MQLAAELLRTTDAKLADVGRALGYGSEAAFSRGLHPHVGESPRGGRDLARAQASTRLTAARLSGALVGRPAAAASRGDPSPTMQTNARERKLSEQEERPRGLVATNRRGGPGAKLLVAVESSTAGPSSPTKFIDWRHVPGHLDAATRPPATSGSTHKPADRRTCTSAITIFCDG